MDVQDNLRKARAVIADQGNWCIGARENDLGQHCALGALEVIGTERTKEYRDAVEVLASVLPAYCDDPRLSYREQTIVNYNDGDGESDNHGCVIAAFDAAIEKAGQS